MKPSHELIPITPTHSRPNKLRTMPDETRFCTSGMKVSLEQHPWTALDLAIVSPLISSPCCRGEVGPCHEAQVTRSEMDRYYRGSFGWERC
jgi:hypothetical protein